MFRCFYLGWYIYVLLVRDWLIDEQALGTQYCECGETLVIHGAKW